MGAWEYGRLERSESGVWVPQGDTRNNEINATDVCISLGYSSGAQILGNGVSPLPGDAIFEASFAPDRFDHTVLMCANPSGAAPWC